MFCPAEYFEQRVSATYCTNPHTSCIQSVHQSLATRILIDLRQYCCSTYCIAQEERLTPKPCLPDLPREDDPELDLALHLQHQKTSNLKLNVLDRALLVVLSLHVRDHAIVHTPRSPPPRPSERRNGHRGRSASRSRSPEREGGGAYRERSYSRSPAPEARRPQSSKIVVEKITRNVNEAHLREIFGSYGRIESVEVPMNRQCK